MSKLILIVDDSASMRMLLKASLVAQGFRIEAANDGVAGLARMHELAPDLLITDINMPEMDGFELIEAVRHVHQFRGTPILVLSTEFSDDKKLRARTVGATGWITKPFDAVKQGVDRFDGGGDFGIGAQAADIDIELLHRIDRVFDIAGKGSGGLCRRLRRGHGNGAGGDGIEPGREPRFGPWCAEQRLQPI